MSKVRVTIDDGTDKIVAILPNSSTDEVLDLLSNEPSETEKTVVENFLAQRGLTVSFETPDSSNVESIDYNAHAETITFNFQDGGESDYHSSFEKFLDAMNASSAGKLQWAYRRGQV